MSHSGKAIIKFRCHNKTGFPSTRQARIFIPGHGAHVLDWPYEKATVRRVLPGGLTLIATCTGERKYDCVIWGSDARIIVPTTQLHFVGETEAPNSEQTYSGT